MADRNKNGIPDNRERFRPGQNTGPVPDSLTGQDRRRAGVNPFFKDLERSGNPFGFLVDPVRQGLNFFGDIPSGLGGFQDEPRSNRYGAGMGDQIFGVQSGFYDKLNQAAPGRQARTGFRREGGGSQEGISPLSYAEALSQALGMIGGQGGPEIPFVNYDSERGAARQNATEADARLEAMYRQLKGSIDADAPAIQASYQQAVDATNQNAGTAQQNIQAANQAADARNSQVLANLGIQDAEAQIIGQGRDAATATAAQVADMAAGQQAATANLTQNQAASIQQNRSIGSAAGLEGNLQRAQNQARLQALLAQIDSEEQNQNAGISAQRASQGQGAFSTAMSLASQLYGANRDDIDRQNQLQMQAIEMQQPNKLQSALGGLSQLLDPKGGIMKQEDLDQDQVIKLLLGLMR